MKLKSDTLTARRIFDLMQLRGIRPKPLAQTAGLGDRAVQDIIDGNSKEPRRSTLEALARYLGCTAEYLMGLTDDPMATAPSSGKALSNDEVYAWAERTTAHMIDALRLEDSEANRKRITALLYHERTRG